MYKGINKVEFDSLLAEVIGRFLCYRDIEENEKEVSKYLKDLVPSIIEEMETPYQG